VSSPRALRSAVRALKISSIAHYADVVVICGFEHRAILMLHLFIAPAPFEGGDEYPFDGTTLSQLLAMLMVIVSLSALALTVCLALPYSFKGTLDC
jgi:hypothetical protein